MALDIDKMLKAVENKSNLPNFFKNNPKIKIELYDFIKKDLNLQEYRNGHDLTNLLAIAFEKAISNKANTQSITGEEIEKNLMAAYRLSDFITTDLYKNLLVWQQNTSKFITK